MAKTGYRVGADGDSLEDLDRTRPLKLGVIGLVDEAHRALAYVLLDLLRAELGAWLNRHGTLIMKWTLAARPTWRGSRGGHLIKNDTGTPFGRSGAAAWSVHNAGRLQWRPCFQPPSPPRLTA